MSRRWRRALPIALLFSAAMRATPPASAAPADEKDARASLEIELPAAVRMPDRLPLRIRNVGAETISGTTRFVFDVESAGSEASWHFTLRPGERTEVTFRIPSEAVLGSEREVFAVVDFDQAGEHVSLVRSGRLEPPPREPEGGAVGHQPVVLAVLVILLFVATAAFESRSRRRDA